MQNDLQNQNDLNCEICGQQVKSAAEICPSCESKLSLSTTLNLFEAETAPHLKQRTLEQVASEFSLMTKETHWKWIQLVALLLILAFAYVRFCSILFPGLLSVHLSDLWVGEHHVGVVSGRAFVGFRDEPLVGKKIYLCRKELISALKADEALKILGAFDQVAPEKMLRVIADSDFRTIKDKVMAHVENSALKYVETNVSGRYEFDELADGHYCLFSELMHIPIVKSEKAPFQWNLWILPVNLNKNSELIDLSKPSVVLIPKASEK